MKRSWIPTLAAAALVAGCTTDSRSRAYRGYDHRYTSYAPPYVVEPERPALELSEDLIASALEGRALIERSRAEAALAELEAAPPRTTAEVAAAIRDAQARGLRDLAGDIAAGHPDVYLWEEAGAVVEVSTRYRGSSNQGRVELTLTRRPEAPPGDLVVVVPAGTYATPLEVAADGDWTKPDQDRRYGHWPSAQDLALLRAPVIELDAATDVVTATAPIACASFAKDSPADGQPFALRRFPPGSPADRLAVALCAGELPREEPAQLALWIARDDVSWEGFTSRGGAAGRLVTFESSRPVTGRHAGEAAQLLLRAGVDPREAAFFGAGAADEPAPAAAPASPGDEGPATEPAPDAEEELEEDGELS